MSDSLDRAVQAVIGLGILACVVAAVEVRTAPLPHAARTHWSAASGTAFRHVARRTFTIDGTTVDGARERPFTGAAVAVPPGRGLAIRGWAFDPATQRSANKLVYRVDAGPWRDASYHLARPDVAAAFGLPGAADSGFRVAVPAGALPPGTHRVSLATIAGPLPIPIPDAVAVVVRGR